MFGTGVDIPRIGLMVVHGQPKTTSAYIQSTGRVGRSRGALVVVFLRATRPRDLNHYEFFCGYHRQLHRYVEPPTVYPFAPNVAEIALGPVLVFILRNMRNVTLRWGDKDSAKEMPTYRFNAKELKMISNYVSQRINQQPPARRVLSNVIQDRINFLLDRWSSVATRYPNLVYSETVLWGTPSRSVVLGDPVHQHAKLTGQLEVVYENTPQSLREVEETIAFEA